MQAWHVMQFAPGTLLVPRSNASVYFFYCLQLDLHSACIDQQMQPQSHGQHYMSNDSILLQHYANMAPMGEGGNPLQADGSMHACSDLDIESGLTSLRFCLC